MLGKPVVAVFPSDATSIKLEQYRNIVEDYLMTDDSKSQTSLAEIDKLLESARQTESALLESKARAQQIVESASETLNTLSTKQTQMENQALLLSQVCSQVEKERASVEQITSAAQSLQTSSQKVATATEADFQRVTEAKNASIELVKEIQTSRETVQIEEKKATTTLAALANEIESLKKQRDALKLTLSEIQQIRTLIDESNKQSQVDVQAITSTKTAFEKLEAEANIANNSLKASQSQASAKIAEIDSVYEKIKHQQAELLEDQVVNGTTAKCVGTQIRELNDQSKNTLAEIKKQATAAKADQENLASKAASDWDGLKTDFKVELSSLITSSEIQVSQLKKTLTDEIRQLLPDAGAAGLASAYYDAKLNYGPGKFARPDEAGGKYHALKYFGAWLWYQIQSRATPLVFYSMFIGPLIFVAYYFHDLMSFLLKHPQNFDPELFLFRVLISLPLVTISLFGWSSIRLHRRLYEEYNHKQRVMQLYDSFKKEIEKLGTPEQTRALLTVMLATVGDKPSLAMHKYDSGFELKPGSFSLGSILDNFLNHTKGASPPAS